MAHADVRLGDKDLDGVDLDDRRRGRGRRLRPARQQGGQPAGSDGNAENDDTRGFHTLSLSTNTQRVGPDPRWRFHQRNVNPWLMTRLQMELMSVYRAADSSPGRSRSHTPRAAIQAVSG